MLKPKGLARHILEVLAHVGIVLGVFWAFRTLFPDMGFWGMFAVILISNWVVFAIIRMSSRWSSRSDHRESDYTHLYDMVEFRMSQFNNKKPEALCGAKFGNEDGGPDCPACKAIESHISDKTRRFI